MRHQTYVGSTHTKLVMAGFQHFQVVIQLKVYVLVKGHFVFRHLTGNHIDGGFRKHFSGDDVARFMVNLSRRAHL